MIEVDIELLYSSGIHGSSLVHQIWFLKKVKFCSSFSTLICCIIPSVCIHTLISVPVMDTVQVTGVMEAKIKMKKERAFY